LLILETSETVWDVPIYPLKLALPVGAFLLLLQGLAKFIRDLVIAIKGEGGLL
jgi:TRAP-type mannitol/chloroaromatic compound transport system permease small subunit